MKKVQFVYFYNSHDLKFEKNKLGYAIESNLKHRRGEYDRSAVEAFDIAFKLPWDDDLLELGKNGKKVFLLKLVNGKKVAPDEFIHKLIDQTGLGKHRINSSKKKTKESFSFDDYEFTEEIPNPTELYRYLISRMIYHRGDFDAALREQLEDRCSIRFIPRPIQAWAKACTIDIKRRTVGPISIVWDFCPRAGKTPISLDYFDYCYHNFGQTLFVVASSWLSSHNSFEKDHQKFYASFGHFRLIKWDDADFADKVTQYLAEGHPVVVTVSIHEAPRSWEKKMSVIRDHPAEKKLLVIDEADFGTKSPIKQEKIEELCNGSDIIRMSGTGIKKMVANVENISGIVSLSYPELVLASLFDSKIFQPSYLEQLDPILNAEELKVCQEIQTEIGRAKYAKAADVCGVGLYTLKAPEKLLDVFSGWGYTENDLPTWGKICQFPQNHANSLRCALGGLFGVEGPLTRFSLWSCWNPLVDGELTHLGVMAFTACETKEQLENLAKWCRMFLKNIVVDYICGDTTDNYGAEDYAKEVAQRVIDEKKDGYLLLTMGMGSRSFSVASLTHVLLMFDAGGIDPLKQKVSRALTPGLLLNGEKKVSGKIVELSFNPNRTEASLIGLLVLDEVLKNKTEKETNEQAAKRIFFSHDSINIWQNDEFDLQPCKFDDYWGEIHHNTDLLQKIGVASYSYEKALQDVRVVEIFLKVIGSKPTSEERQSIAGRTKSLKSNIPPKKKTAKEKNEEKALLKKIEEAREALHKSPINLMAIFAVEKKTDLATLVGTRSSYLNVIDFLAGSKAGSAAVVDEIGITPAEIRQLINGGHLKAALLDSILHSQLEMGGGQ